MMFILPNDKDGLPLLEKQLTLDIMMELRKGIGSRCWNHKVQAGVFT